MRKREIVGCSGFAIWWTDDNPCFAYCNRVILTARKGALISFRAKKLKVHWKIKESHEKT